MKKIIGISLLFLSLLVSGCSDACDVSRCRESVNQAFPNAEVTTIPNTSPYAFLVRTSSGEIWLAKCMSSISNEVTDKTKIFNANKVEK